MIAVFLGVVSRRLGGSGLGLEGSGWGRLRYRIWWCSVVLAVLLVVVSAVVEVFRGLGRGGYVGDQLCWLGILLEIC